MGSFLSLLATSPAHCVEHSCPFSRDRPLHALDVTTLVPRCSLWPHLTAPNTQCTSAVFSLVCLPVSTMLPEGWLAVTLKPRAGHQQSVSGSRSRTSKTTLTRECFTILYEACFPETGRFICISLNGYFQVKCHPSKTSGLVLSKALNLDESDSMGITTAPDKAWSPQSH